MLGKRGKCWPAGARSNNWQVQARGGAGHAASSWRKWMEPVRPHPLGTQVEEQDTPVAQSRPLATIRRDD